MDGEYLERRNLVRLTTETRATVVQASWQEALRRIAKAQSLLWNETPIAKRQALLAQVDREIEGRERQS